MYHDEETGTKRVTIVRIPVEELERLLNFGEGYSILGMRWRDAGDGGMTLDVQVTGPGCYLVPEANMIPFEELKWFKVRLRDMEREKV